MDEASLTFFKNVTPCGVFSRLDVLGVMLRGSS